MESHKDKSKSYQWTEPKWSYQPRAKAELSGILNLKMWLRIIFVVALLASSLAYIVKRAVPDFEFNWFGALATSFGALAFYMAVMFVVFWFVPPSIKIWNKGIMRQQGSTHRTLLRPNIHSITIDTSDSTRPLLRMETTGRPLECGIASNVSLPDLTAFLHNTFPESIVTEKR